MDTNLTTSSQENSDVGLIVHSDIYRGIRTSYTNKTIITNE